MTTGAALMYGGAAEYFRRLIGGDVEPVESLPTIGTTSVVVKSGDPECVQLTIVNLSANTVYLRPNRTASATAGILLASNGGSVSMVAAEDGTLPAQEWQAVATAAGSPLYVTGLRRITREG